MSSIPSNPRRAAENALWDALKERHDQIRAAGVGFSERQPDQLRKAYEAGELIDWMHRAMENYPGDGNLDNLAALNLDNLAAMARTIKRGLPTWEHVLIRPGEPWTPYVTPKARRGAENSIGDATAYIKYLF